MAIVASALVLVLALMCGELGRPDRKANFRGMFSNNRSVNVLASARIFLFASRDVWFVVGVPVFLRAEEAWSFWQVGAFLAMCVIGYGFVQATAPRYVKDPDGHTATWLAFALAAFPAAVAIAFSGPGTSCNVWARWRLRRSRRASSTADSRSTIDAQALVGGLQRAAVAVGQALQRALPRPLGNGAQRGRREALAQEGLRGELRDRLRERACARRAEAPVAPSVTMLVGPPSPTAITGSPLACASSRTCPNVSVRLAKRKMSALA